MPLRVLDVLRPLLVVTQPIHADPEDLAIALVELRLDPRHIAELGGADRREVFRVREQNRPTIADPFVEIDRTLCRVSREVRGNIVDTQRHENPPPCSTATFETYHVRDALRRRVAIPWPVPWSVDSLARHAASERESCARCHNRTTSTWCAPKRHSQPAGEFAGISRPSPWPRSAA